MEGAGTKAEQQGRDRGEGFQGLLNSRGAALRLGNCMHWGPSPR